MTARIDVSKNVRTAMGKLLNAQLASAIDMHARAKQAHWNITGPSFIAVHELLDKVADHAESAGDAIAERARALGVPALGLLPDVVRASGLPPFGARGTGPGNLPALADSLAAFGQGLRASIDAADEAGDKVTADLFTGLAGENDKLLWFVESHLG